MLVWRLASPAYSDILTGEGNRIFGARWNSPGCGVVYTSANLSLAVLEAYVHIPPVQRDALPDFVAVCIQVPDDAGRTDISVDQLESLIASADPLAACRTVGDRWLSRGDDLILRAPSVVISEEHNVMLNPAHPRMRDVAVVSTRRFRFDPRLAAR